MLNKNSLIACFIFALCGSGVAFAESAMMSGGEIKRAADTKQKPRLSVLSEFRDEMELKGLDRKTKLIEAEIKLVIAKAELATAKGELTKTEPHAVKSVGAARKTPETKEAKRKAPPKQRVIKKPTFELLEIYGSKGGDMPGFVAVIREKKEIFRGGVGSRVGDGWNITALSPLAVLLKKGNKTIRIGLSAGITDE